MDNRYHYFAGALFASVSEADMQASIPIWTYDRNIMPADIGDAADDWRLHSSPYLAGIDWFEETCDQHGYEQARNLFCALSLARKTIVKRGYQIKYQNGYLPLLNGTRYFNNAAIKVGAKSRGKFPAGRILGNAKEGQYVR